MARAIVRIFLPVGGRNVAISSQIYTKSKHVGAQCTNPTLCLLPPLAETNIVSEAAGKYLDNGPKRGTPLH